MVLYDNYSHGGDIYKNKIELDFSANVNPFGTPDEVKEAIKNCADSLSLYPDPYCMKLRHALSEYTGADYEDIICGNGAAELIFSFAFALGAKNALLPVPSFSEYDTSLRLSKSEIKYFYLKKENDYKVTEELLPEITGDTDVLMLCSPNNPTGMSIERDLLLKILNRCRETDTWLFLDECFYELTDEEYAVTLINELKSEDKVFLLRAFTKMYGMAGVRLGYAICKNTYLKKKMCEYNQPWNVSALAQAAGEAAVRCTDFAKKTKDLVKTERKYLYESIKACGLNVLEGKSNYLMITDAPGLYDFMLKNKVLIRSCGNYEGLSANEVRIAVKTHDMNEKLINLIKEYTNGN